MKKNGLKKILTFLMVLALAVVLFFLSAFFGNPLSHFLASQTAKRYMEETYADTDYVIEEVFYSFKDNQYHARVLSPSSKDTYFTLQMDLLGRFKGDSYEDLVVSKWNTGRRLDEAYRDLVESVFSDMDFPYTFDIYFGNLEMAPESSLDAPETPDFALNQDDLVLDKDYDIHELGRQAGKVTLFVDNDEVTVEKAAEVLLAVRAQFDRMKVPFKAMDFSLQHPRKDDKPRDDVVVSVQNFLYTDIHPDGLAERVKKAHDALMVQYAAEDKALRDRRPMVMVEGALYYFVDDEVRAPKAGQVYDGKISTMVDSSEIPFQDDQSNFGKDYNYLLADEGQRLEVYIDGDHCMIFTKLP